MDTAIDLDFADGRYRFWLPLPQIMELERKTDASILTIEERLRGSIGAEGSKDDPTFLFIGGGSATIADVRETIRLGIIGGDNAVVEGQEIEVGPNLARSLVDNYVYPARPMAEGVVLAWRILHAAIHGVQLSDKKKAESEPGEMNDSEKGK
ncbi:gene transfer agent family protein [Erythrobacter sp. SCSIO 43205]|uniref:gene transfer agent family protein n=1 Tax=Erythrobacter sp. SCSIO 43205 TaxID=2779361 RepID=UPI001CA932DB|nr:gene transfer agent family protein [Erythrobacter sp. SCSIO 43205]UAB76957.1 gene transfer agent family protein [Erythrobacter sp. SCSIO 43205]